MALIDWRELYAQNRAAIDGARVRGPAPTPLRGGARAARARPGSETGAGTWEQRSHRHGGRERTYYVYAPPGLAPSTPVPLVLMLHGCTQDAAGFAAGTRMNRLADLHGFVVAYPEQSRSENPQGCWNWFEPAHRVRGAGDPAFIAGAARSVAAERGRWRIDDRRICVAGLSAGGAMAGIAAAAYPDVFAAVAVHSGLAYGCAGDVGSAFAAMRRGGQHPEQHAQAALGAMQGRVRPVPAIVIHGTADRTVCPVNGDQVVEQWSAVNRRAACAPSRSGVGAPPSGAGSGEWRETTTIRAPADGARGFTRRRWVDGDGRLMVEDLRIDGLGHAWAGGAPGASYTDTAGPSASDAIREFFAEALG